MTKQKSLISIISLIITVLFITSLLSTMQLTADAAELSPVISADSVTADKGDKNVAVNVYFRNNPGIASAALNIHYDKSALKLTNFKYNTDALAGSCTVPFSTDAKTPCLSAVNGSKNITGDFIFATLYFDVITDATGQYDISFSYDEDNIYDISENNVAFLLESGAINIVNDNAEHPAVITTTTIYTVHTYYTKFYNTLTVKVAAKAVKRSVLKKKSVSVKPVSIKKAKGKVTVAKVKSGTSSKIYKKITVNKKTGAVKLKKGTYKKGTYKIKIKVKAAGNSDYKASTKTITTKIKVK